MTVSSDGGPLSVWWYQETLAKHGYYRGASDGAYRGTPMTWQEGRH